MPSSKICQKCKCQKLVSAFNKNRSTEDGLQNRCRDCAKEYDRSPRVRKRKKEWYKEYYHSKRGEKARKRVAEKARLRNFGVTPDDYSQMFAEQDGRCKICGRHQSELERELHVDHNCETGQVRGLLCFNCNVGLGHLRHNVELLQNAISYLTDSDSR